MVQTEMAVVTLTADQVADLREDLGRRFGEWDLSSELVATAERFATNYDGDVGFMAAMRDALASYGRLTPRQAAGVLNTMVYDTKKARAEQGIITDVASPVTKPVAAGRYTVPVPGEGKITIRIEEPNWGNFEDGATVAKVLARNGWKGFATVSPIGAIRWWRDAAARVTKGKALITLLSAEDPIAYGLEFAEATGRCWRCGKELEVPASIHRGVGPVCARHLGLI